MPIAIALRLGRAFGLIAGLCIAISSIAILAANWCNQRAEAWNKRAGELLDDMIGKG